MNVGSLARRYRVAAIAAAGFVALALAFPAVGAKAGTSLVDQLKTMLLVLPPIFVLLGLLDVWVPKKTLQKSQQ